MNSDIVTCGDLQFKKLYTRQQIDTVMDQLAKRVDDTFSKIKQQDPNAEFIILGVLNGAFMITSELVRRLVTPVRIQFVKVVSYKGTESGELTIQSKLDNTYIKGRHVLILDDICDTGKTLAKLSDIFKALEAKTVLLGVLVTRPDKQHAIEPDFSGLTCSQFIIGYGLDYRYYGRQYPEIYQKI